LVVSPLGRLCPFLFPAHDATEVVVAKLSTILDQIDAGTVLLPEFQRGYVWNPRHSTRMLAERRKYSLTC
jgi:hypothetical protein